MPWVPRGKRLRQLREIMELSVAKLAKQSGAGERTIREIEAGRTFTVQLGTLKGLAAVLECDITELATEVDEVPTAPARGARTRANASPPPTATRLEALVALEQELRRAPGMLETPEGALDQLTPKRFQDVMTAFRLHVGARFWLVGQVMQQRGITIDDATLLGSESGVGARFLIKIPVIKEDALFVTAYATTAEQTLELQRRMSTREPTVVALRVLVTRVIDGAVAVMDADPAMPRSCASVDPSRWGGFPIFGSQTLHPWAYVVTRLIERVPPAG